MVNKDVHCNYSSVLYHLRVIICWIINLEIWKLFKLTPFESLGAISYTHFIVTMAVSLAIFKISSVKEWRELENWVRGCSRSLKMAPFDRPYTTFYRPLYVYLHLVPFSSYLALNNSWPWNLILFENLVEISGFALRNYSPQKASRIIINSCSKLHLMTSRELTSVSIFGHVDIFVCPWCITPPQFSDMDISKIKYGGSRHLGFSW